MATMSPASASSIGRALQAAEGQQLGHPAASRSPCRRGESALIGMFGRDGARSMRPVSTRPRIGIGLEETASIANGSPCPTCGGGDMGDDQVEQRRQVLALVGQSSTAQPCLAAA